MHFKRGKCRYETKRRRPSMSFMRKRLGLKPVRYERHEVRDINWGDYRWHGNWPKWFDIVYHNRPRRHQETRLENAVLRGDDPEAILWPESKKPHKYYW